MATAVENLNKHLQLAVRKLKVISGTVNEIPDSTFELVDGPNSLFRGSAAAIQ